jgi:monovalent cation/hydrogen antiporter
MRGLYQFRRRRLNGRGGSLDDDGAQDRSLAYQRLVHELLEAQHREIVQLRNQGQISNQVMGRIERDLDLEDSRLEIWETP